MSARTRSNGLPKRLAVAAGLSVAALAALGVAVAYLQRAPEGPQPVAWNREVCAHCRMHVSEPAYAAQLHLADGQVLSFDDPGCLFAWERAHKDPVRARWFHLRTERWAGDRDVRFVHAEPTPMGYGLAATDADAPDALTLEQARARLAAGGEG